MVLFVAKVVLVFVDTVVLVAFTIVVVAVAFAANEVVELLFCIVSGDEDRVIFEDGIVVELLLTPLLTACVGGAEVVVSFPLITVVPSDVEFDKSLVSRFRILR